MTKSKGVGRGGARPGSGPKRKPGAAAVGALRPAAAPPQPNANDEPPPASAGEIEGLALATLRQIMIHSPLDGPRVSAAKEVLVRAQAEREASGQTGKKAQRQASAEQVAGKFAVPAAPKLVVDNKR